MKVNTEKTKGIIDGNFGKTGKVKVLVQEGSTDDCKVNDIVHMEFKRYIYDEEKKMIQNWFF